MYLIVGEKQAETPMTERQMVADGCNNRKRANDLVTARTMLVRRTYDKNLTLVAWHRSETLVFDGELSPSCA